MQIPGPLARMELRICILNKHPSVAFKSPELDHLGPRMTLNLSLFNSCSLICEMEKDSSTSYLTVVFSA